MPPTRRCIGCRQSDEKQMLLRFVWDGARVVHDKTHTHQARGAYLHRKVRCWEKTAEVKRWTRAFRLPERSLSREQLAEITEMIRQIVLGKSETESPGKNRAGGKIAGPPGKKIRL